jgi:hypothetical protein
MARVTNSGPDTYTPKAGRGFPQTATDLNPAGVAPTPNTPLPGSRGPADDQEQQYLDSFAGRPNTARDGSPLGD